jgi:uncharacterized paraquat-inducible protein A
METQTAYCPECDKTVHVARTPVAPHTTHANVVDGGKLVCLEVGEECEDRTCPLSGRPTLVMGVRLARSGVVPDDEWPHAVLECDGCDRTVGMEVLDTGHLFCPICRTTHTVALRRKADGDYEVVSAA